MTAITTSSQRGIALIVVLIWLMVATLLAVSAVQIGLQEQKAARSQRDQDIALQAAEAGLLDAEMDIENSPDLRLSRSALFGRRSMAGFPQEQEPLCQRGGRNPYQGLCRLADASVAPAWQQVDLSDEAAATTVAYGRFTGRSMQTGVGMLPARLPRYLIELMRYRQVGESAEQPEYFYRITAIGFGASGTSQVVLQSYYRKGNGS
ncbi:pilus assembly PilX family protein [Actimicrobium antarcticum]|uniref:Pilus assembly protein PilX n=1 Tax=Actimicrobium antarcticum TaxID=1051899 RepID=A0ABP7TUD4_9BURK